MAETRIWTGRETWFVIFYLLEKTDSNSINVWASETFESLNLSLGHWSRPESNLRSVSSPLNQRVRKRQKWNFASPKEKKSVSVVHTCGFHHFEKQFLFCKQLSAFTKKKYCISLPDSIGVWHPIAEDYVIKFVSCIHPLFLERFSAMKATTTSWGTWGGRYKG